MCNCIASWVNSKSLRHCWRSTKDALRILVYLARLHFGALLLGPPVRLHTLVMGFPVDLDFVNAVSAASMLLAASA